MDVANRTIMWNEPAVDDTPDYLCFTANQVNSTIQLSAIGTPSTDFTVETSSDKKTWNSFTPGTTKITLSNTGDKVYFRAGEDGNQAVCTNGLANRWQFITTGSLNCSGCLESILDRNCETSAYMAPYSLGRLFISNNTAIKTAPYCKAKKLVGNGHYSHLYDGTGITHLPLSCFPRLELSGNATTANVFYNQTSLTCAYLNLPMSFKPYGTKNQAEMNGYFANCTNLLSAILVGQPENYNTNSMGSMFAGCTKLKYIEVDLSSWPLSTVNNNWVSKVASTGTFVCPTALGTNSTIERGVCRCPANWTVINK